MKKSELKQIIKEEIKNVLKEVDNSAWMDITNALILNKMFDKKSTYKFVDTNSINPSTTKSSLENYLMTGVKDGKWDEKNAKDYLLAIVGTMSNEGKSLK